MRLFIGFQKKILDCVLSCSVLCGVQAYASAPPRSLRPCQNLFLKAYRTIVPLLLVLCCLILCFPVGCFRPSFVRENLSSFEEFSLRNGIRVVVKVTDENRIRSLVTVLYGGASNVPADKAGLEDLALALASYESEHYDNTAMRVLLKETSASIGYEVNLDYTTYSLKAIDAYFDRDFDLYADLFLRPTLTEKYFMEVKTNALNGYRASLTDGYSRVSLALNRAYLKGHPYEAGLSNPEALEAMTLEDIQTYYRNNRVASRMAIFAVGNFEIESLREKLEASFGAIPRGDYSPPALRPLGEDKGIPLLLDGYGDMRKDVAYVRCNFVNPDVTDRDYWATVLAFDLLDDLLTDLIRTKEGLVYSMFAYNMGKKANYAQISAYKTMAPVRVLALIGEAVDILASGRCVAPSVDVSADGKGELGAEMPGEKMGGSDYVPISEAIEFYKASFETGYFQGLEANLSIAKKLAYWHVMTGDYRAYLYTVKRIEAVTAEDIARVARTHIQAPAKSCAITAHPDLIDSVRNAPPSCCPNWQDAELE